VAEGKILVSLRRAAIEQVVKDRDALAGVKRISPE